MASGHTVAPAGGPDVWGRESGGCFGGKWARRGRLFAGQFGDLDRGPDFLDPDQHLDPQVTGDVVVAAVLVHQPLDRLFQAVLPQARAALVEMLADLRLARGTELAVQVGVDPVEYLATRSLVGFPAAHDASLPDSAGAPTAMAVVTAAEAKNQNQNDDEYEHLRSSFLFPGRS